MSSSLDIPTASIRDVTHVPLMGYLRQKQFVTDSVRVTTHACMTAGKYHVTDALMNEFQGQVADAIRHGTNGQMACISEQHSAVFPMYADLDLKVPCETLTVETAIRMAKVMTEQFRRFYPPSSSLPSGADRFECIVCVKNGVATPVDDDGKSVAAQLGGGPPPTLLTADDLSSLVADPPPSTPLLYKQGVHLHWPYLLVDIERAAQIRTSMVCALDRVLDWTPHLGVARVDWEDAVDKSVYTNGLRMVGAPKPSPCPECRGNRDVSYCGTCKCRNCHKLIDERVYVLGAVLGKDGERDLEAEHTLRSNAIHLVKKTTVRAPSHATPTEGYAPYEGCPPATGLAVGATRKRKLNGKFLPTGDDSSRLEGRFRKAEDVTDPAVIAVLQRQLVKHSDKYERTKVTPRRIGNEYRVMLSGDGALYCLNKLDSHKRNRVYMVVTQSKSAHTYESVMRCFCPCATARQGMAGNVCSLFRSPRMLVDTADIPILFPSKPPNGYCGKSAPERVSMSDADRHLESALRNMERSKALFLGLE